jgi:hypothetical protein
MEILEPAFRLINSNVTLCVILPNIGNSTSGNATLPTDFTQCRSQIYVVIRALSLAPFLSVLLFTAGGLIRRNAFVKVQLSWRKLVGELASLPADPSTSHGTDILNAMLCLVIATSVMLVGTATHWTQIKSADPGGAASIIISVSCCFIPRYIRRSEHKRTVLCLLLG